MTITLPSKRKQWAIIGTAFVVVHLICYIIYQGRPLDDAEHYLKAGMVLLREGRIDDHFHAFYFIPISLLAVFTWLFGDPGVAFIFFQTATSALAVVLLYRTTEVISTQGAAFISALIFVLWIDNVRWDVLVMTESLFGSITIFALYRFLTSDYGRRHIWQLMGIVLVGIFTRPVGVLLATAVVVSIIVDCLRRRRVPFAIGVLFVLVMTSCLIVIAYYLSQTWDFTDQYFRGNVITYADTYEGDNTWITFNPYYTDDSNRPSMLKAVRFASQRPWHVMLVSFLKFFYLVSGVRPYYSIVHNLSTVFWMTFVYTGAAIGSKALRASAFKTVLFALIAGNCLLVTMTTVDWDNRFYVPMEAAVIILSAIGWSEVLTRRFNAKQSFS